MRHLYVLSMVMLVALSLTVDASQKGRRKKPPPTPPPSSPAWQIDYSAGVTLEQTAEGPRFVFPTGNGHVNMLTQGWGGVGGGTVVSTVRITVLSGAPVFQVYAPLCDPGTKGARGRFYMQAPDWTTAGDYARWWSALGYVQLGPGVISIAAALDPATWSSVHGKYGTYNADALAGFYRTMQGGGRIGFTFGGGCHYGHGVYVSGGSADFTVLDYRIE